MQNNYTVINIGISTNLSNIGAIVPTSFRNFVLTANSIISYIFFESSSFWICDIGNNKLIRMNNSFVQLSTENFTNPVAGLENDNYLYVIDGINNVLVRL